MKTNKYFLISSIVLLLTGCGGATQWYLNGNTEQQFRMDEAKCSAIASGNYQGQGAHYVGYGAGSGDSTLAGVGALLTALEYGDMMARYNNCMAQHGYTIAR